MKFMYRLIEVIVPTVATPLPVTSPGGPGGPAAPVSPFGPLSPWRQTEKN